MDKTPKLTFSEESKIEKLKVTELPKINIIEREPFTAEETIKWRETFLERQKTADEVCLKYKKGDDFNYSVEKVQLVGESSPRYMVVIDGADIGYFSLGEGEDGQGKIIQTISLNENIHGKGLGKKLYVSINEYLKETEGSVLKQSYQTGDGSNGVWESLFKDGLVEIMPENSPNGYKIPWMKNDYLPKETKLYRFKK